MKLYDYYSLAGCLDKCSCGSQPGILPVNGTYIKGQSTKGCVLVVECPSCFARSDEGDLLKIMLSWNLEQRKMKGTSNGKA